MKIMKKGFALVSDVGWTLFFLIAVLFIAFIGLIISANFQFRGGGLQSYSLEFVVANNKPFLLAASLTHFLASDRQFIEHATEIIAAGSVRNAASDDLDIYLKDFFRQYKDVRFIGVAIKAAKDDGEEQLFYVDNVPKKCGDDLSGFCVESKRTFTTRPEQEDIGGGFTVAVGCTDGRIAIETSKYTNNDNKCQSPAEVCCVEGKVANGLWPPNTVTCGAVGGEEGDIDANDPGVCDYIGGGCSAGRIEIEDKGNECNPLTNPRSQKTGTCCVPLKGDILVETGLASTAEIPLVYKDSRGVAEVTVR